MLMQAQLQNKAHTACAVPSFSPKSRNLGAAVLTPPHLSSSLQGKHIRLRAQTSDSSPLAFQAKAGQHRSAGSQQAEDDPSLGCSVSGREEVHASHPRHSVSRRLFAASLGACMANMPAASAQPSPTPGMSPPGEMSREACLDTYEPYLRAPDWFGPGPLSPVRLPIKLTHVLTSCYSSGFAGTSCQVKFDVFYPKGGGALGLGPPYPLALITSGFLVSSEAYKSYAERLASWGYAVLLYDKQETVSDVLDDVTSVAALRQCLDLAASDPLIKRVADPNRVYLVGHSRGGKISALAALEDPRVVALCLIDPVDNTVYAPIAPGFPSAVAALQGSVTTNNVFNSGNRSSSSSRTVNDSMNISSSGGSSSSTRNEGSKDGNMAGTSTPSAGSCDVSRIGLEKDDADSSTSSSSGSRTSRAGLDACASLPASFPVAIVGSGIGGDCAPSVANYRQFFNATRGPAWEVGIKNAGHFQYLDATSPLQSYLCPSGPAPDSQVRHLASGVIVAWAELCFRHNGKNVLGSSSAAPPAPADGRSVIYPLACMEHGKVGGNSQPGSKESFPWGPFGDGRQGSNGSEGSEDGLQSGLVFDASLQESLEAALRGQSRSGILDVSTRYKGFGARTS